MFIAALFTIAGHGSNLNVHRQMNKEDVVYIYNIYIYILYTHTHTHTHTMEYYSAIKQNEIMPFAATQMDLEIIILSESGRERQIPYDITYICEI